MLSPILICSVVIASVIAQPGPKMIDETTRWSQCKDVNQSIYDFQMETLQGQFTDLSQYKGQVLLIINVATFCGPKMIDETTRWSQCKDVNQSIYDFQMETLQGQFTDLSQYKGQVLLIINVATFCAYTQQYTDFNPLIEKNVNGGFTILAFPCNQFYLQEPAENHELMNGIMYVRPGNGWKPHQNLHIYGKIDVNGENHHPLYEFLKESCPQTVEKIGKTNELMYNPVRANDITWNFEKFLIDRQGRPRFRFHPTAWSHGDVVQPFIDQLMNESA
ncbi:glutathione peroxidase [Oesophagostomum dentatum]|uniref:Glutathione peroxidase n=1 Tax=Oesophagostomum dentatum TaxID=61180 RepID=A0A0B1TF98_OESDE|nr:glutathione peroxidase [Oesophagostomum dentatum]